MPSRASLAKIVKWEWAWIVALAAVALVLRLAWLERVPPGVRFDELVNVKIADHIYAGEWPIYFQEAWGHEPLYHYVHATGMLLLGKTVLGVRITSILFGVLGVLTAYLLFRRLFGWRVGLIAAALIAASFWSLLYSRIGLRHISLPPWICLAAYCYWRGLEAPVEQRAHTLLWFGLGGFCQGLLLHTYFASRAVPLIFAAFTLYLLLAHPAKLRGRLWGLLLFFALPALMATPMVLYLRWHPELEQRLGQVAAEILTGLRQGNPVPLIRSALNTLKMFGIQGDPEWLYNISGRPVFDPLAALLFYGGVLVALWRWRDPRRAFLVLWLAVGIAPTMASWPPGSLGHSIAALPVVYALPALMLVDVLDWTHERPWLRRAALALVVVVPITFVSINVYDYFVRWPRFPDVQHEYQAPISAVARYVQRTDIPTEVTVSAPYVDHWNPWSVWNYRLFVAGFRPAPRANVRWFNGIDSLLLPAAQGTQTEVLMILPDHIRLPSELHPDLKALLVPGLRELQKGYPDPNGATLDLYLWEDRTALEQRLRAVAAADAWTSAEGLYLAGQSEPGRTIQPLPVNVGDRLSFLGYSDKRGSASGQTWQVTTYWQVLESDQMDGPLALFVHVLDDANNVIAGWDGLHAAVSSWKPGDVFVQIHTLYLPPQAASGTYRVQVGVYSPLNLERLPIYTGQGDTTAPHSRLLLSPLELR